MVAGRARVILPDVMTPFFITFEGLDGSGKSTHLERFSKRLQEKEVDHVVAREPGGTPLGKAVRRIFLDHRWEGMDGRVEALLLFASRRQLLLEVVDPALAAGRHVLCDRFTDSTFAYQGAGRGVSWREIEVLSEISTGLKKPDRTLLFDLPAEEARNRGQSDDRRATPGGVDRLDAEQLGFYERVRQGYLDLAARDPERYRLVDSGGSHEITERQVSEALGDLFGTEP